MGSVSDRRSRGRGWEARWYSVDGEGTRKQHSKSFETKREAVNYRKLMDGDVASGKYRDPDRGKVPFTAVAEDWYRTVEPGLKKKTAAGYRSILDYHLLPTFGAMPLNAITAGDVRRFISDPKWLPGTRRNILRVLSLVLGNAVLDERIDVNPVVAARAPIKKLLRSRPNKNLPFLDPVEVDQLAEEVGSGYSTLIYAAAYTGLRAGELAALRMRNLDLLHRELKVEESVSDVGGHLSIEKPKTEESSRTVTLPPLLLGMLEERINGKAPGEFVFGGVGPFRHGNFYARHFRPAVNRLVESGRWPEKLAGLRFHDLRHTAAAILIANGEHPKAIADRLGHSSITITMDRYGHLYKTDLDEVADRLNETMREAREARPEPVSVTPIRSQSG